MTARTAYTMITMTVKVHLDTKEAKEHPGADKVDMVDGHLFVQHLGNRGGKKTLAVYAPGRWHSAEVMPETERDATATTS